MSTNTIDFDFEHSANARTLDFRRALDGEIERSSRDPEDDIDRFLSLRGVRQAVALQYLLYDAAADIAEAYRMEVDSVLDLIDLAEQRVTGKA